MLTRNELYYGHAEPLPEASHLRAGPLTLVYQAGDLRYLKLGQTEILRRIYMAIRDRNWVTIPPVLSNVEIEANSNSFHLTYQAENKQGEIDFFWTGVLSGDREGIITFTFEGQAHSDFSSNRLGFCVLHPIHECAGQPCRVTHVDGSLTDGVFPKYISPHQPFLEMAAIAHEIQPGVWAEVSFAGDIFEMEDQRNWMDGSYKTYCTPLRLGFPHLIKAGTRIRQTVTVRLHVENDQSRVAINTPAPAETAPILRLETGQQRLPLPQLGLGVASHGQQLSAKELERLRVLNLSHLRIDLHLYEANYPAKLRQAWEAAQALDLRLEVALHLSDEAETQLQSLRQQLEMVKPRLWAWLVFHIKEKSTTEKWIELARTALAGYDPQALIGSGTNSNFTELNRSRPPAHALDLICYSVNPQVHASDNASLVETLEAVRDIVASARQFIGALPIAVTPITLKQRFNPDATAPAAPSAPSWCASARAGDEDAPAAPESERKQAELPRSVDVRQLSLFGVGWTLGTFKHWAESGVQSLTYYETTGWRGVMETAEGSAAPSAPSWCASARAGDEDAPAAPELFRSLPGSVFPLYHVLADIGEFAGGEIIPTHSTETLQVEGLALHKRGRTRVLVANLQGAEQSISITGLGTEVRVRYLDETNALESMRSPEAFRAQVGEVIRTSGQLTLKLQPYAVVRVDF